MTGDETSALQAVLAADPERLALLAEEAALMAALNADGADAKPAVTNGSGARAGSSCQPEKAPSGALLVLRAGFNHEKCKGCNVGGLVIKSSSCCSIVLLQHAGCLGEAL